MTYPADPNNPSGSGYPGYPQNYPSAGGYPGYPTARPGRMRGQRALKVGAILMAIGVVLAAIGVVISGTGADSKVNGFQRVKVADQTGTVTFKHSGGYIAYYESNSVTDSSSQKVPLIEVTLTNQTTGQALKLDTPYGNRTDNKIKYLHYDHDGHKGLAMWQFHIDQAGTYKADLRDTSGLAASDAAVAFGKSIASSQAIGGIVVILGVLLLLAGLIVLIVGFVKQRRHKRVLQAGYGGVQPAGWPQGTPPSWPGGAPSWPGGAPGGGQATQQWPPPGDAQPGWPPPPE